MLRFVTVLIAAPLLAVATPALADILPPVVIENDEGGYGPVYAAALLKLLSQRRHVNIRGECASACTMYLALPRTCVHPQARLLFHAPTYNGRISKHAIEQLMSLYPPALQQWITERGGLTRKWLVLKGEKNFLEAGLTVCEPDTPSDVQSGDDITERQTVSNPIVAWPYDQVLCHPDYFNFHREAPVLLIPKHTRTARWWWEEGAPVDVDIAELELVDLFGNSAVRYEGELYSPCD